MSRHALHSALFLLLIAPAVAQAALVEFDHIEYDPVGSDSGHEWVRIHNVSGAQLDLTNWRFVEGGANHKLTPSAGSVVRVDGYAIIAADAAQYVADHPASSDTIFDSSFSLSNSGEVLAFKDASSTIIVSESYTATPKLKVATVPKSGTKSTSKIGSTKTTPRILHKEPSQITAALADAPVTHDFGFWPWLLGALIIGVGAGGALWYVRQGRSQTGYSVIDISDKPD